MKIYIASSLENAGQVARFAEHLEAAGHSITYKWWSHGSVFDPTASREDNVERMMATAEDEINGVVAADATVVLMPGGKGTHVELGAALVSVAYLADEFRMVMIGGADDPLDTADSKPTCFWYHPRVLRVWERDETVLFRRLIENVEMRVIDNPVETDVKHVWTSGGKFFFSDETENFDNQRFDTKAEAVEALRLYGERL